MTIFSRIKKVTTPIIYIIRGLSGTGKTTLGLKLLKYGYIDSMYQTDDYFYLDGKYIFDGRNLQKAHQWCQNKVSLDLSNNKRVAVCNTFTTRWEMEWYLLYAKKNNIEIRVITLDHTKYTDEELFIRNVHNVPLNIISNMRKRWETDWYNSSPIPPWKRNNCNFY